MPAEHLRLNIERGVAVIALDRPEAKNAFDSIMAGALADACDRINYDEDIRVAIIQGNESAFCCGDESQSDPPVAEMVAAVAKPVIACVTGDAIGAGLELALACDLRLAADSARLGMPFLVEGGFPRNGGTQRLPRLIGRAKAAEMLFLARTLDAAEAVGSGLVARALPAGEVVAEARRLASRMAAMAPFSLRFAKEAINKGMDMTMDQGLRLEADLYFLMQTTADRVEGITAFLKKRAPEFKGK